MSAVRSAGRTAAVALAAVLAAPCGCQRLGSAPPADVCIEAEAAVRGADGAPAAPPVPGLLASGGALVELAGGAALRFELTAPAGAAWWWRVARTGGGSDDDRAATVEWCTAAGRPLAPPERVTLARAAHPECYDWRSLGAAPAGAGALRVTLAAGDGCLRIDAFVGGAAARGRTPPIVVGPDTWRSRDGRHELRAAPGARVADPEWTLALLRDAVAAVAARLQVEPAGPLVLFALPGGDPAFEARGGFQNGNALFLRDDELHLPWRGYAHELVHVIEEQRELALPWSFSEGLACAIALDVALHDFGGIEGPAREAERLARLLRDGDGWWRPGGDGANPLLPWVPPPEGAGDAKDGAARGAAYAWATLLVREAAARGGPGFYARLLAELERTRGGAADRFLPALEAAAGRSLRDLFREVGLKS